MRARWFDQGAQNVNAGRGLVPPPLFRQEREQSRQKWFIPVREQAEGKPKI